MLFWAAGTWWIPLLIMLGVWKHVVKKVKLPLYASGYDVSYWSLVFPLGMYAVSTFRVAEVLEISFLKPLSLYVLFFAIVAWSIILSGLISRLWSGFRKPAQAEIKT